MNTLGSSSTIRRPGRSTAAKSTADRCDHFSRRSAAEPWRHPRAAAAPHPSARAPSPSPAPTGPEAAHVPAFIRPMASITAPCSPIAARADRTHACSAAGCSLCPNNRPAWRTPERRAFHWLDRPRPHAVRLRRQAAGPAAAVISAGIAACPVFSGLQTPAPAATRGHHHAGRRQHIGFGGGIGNRDRWIVPNRAATFAVVDGCCGSRANPFRAAPCRRSIFTPANGPAAGRIGRHKYRPHPRCDLQQHAQLRRDVPPQCGVGFLKMNSAKPP